MKIYK